MAYLARTINDDCRRSRFAALLASAGNRSVWLLYNEHPSNESLSALKRQNLSGSLNLARQPNVTRPEWRTFGGKMIGYSKAAFVIWLLTHPECQYTWQLEDDNFFTGRWSDFFDAHLPQMVDLIAPTTALADATLAQLSANKGGPAPSAGPEYARAHNCFLSSSNSSADSSVPCRRWPISVIVWPLIRLSHRLARELAQTIDDRGGHGFHEYMLAPVCDLARRCAQLTVQVASQAASSSAARADQAGRAGEQSSIDVGERRRLGQLCSRVGAFECTIAPPHTSLIGVIDSGHTQGITKAHSTLARLVERVAGRESSRDRRVASHHPLRNATIMMASARHPPPHARMVFHPAKCEADPLLGGEAWRWM